MHEHTPEDLPVTDQMQLVTETAGIRRVSPLGSFLWSRVTDLHKELWLG